MNTLFTELEYAIYRDCENSFPDRIRPNKDAAAYFGDIKLIAVANEETLNEIEMILIYHFTELLHPPKMAKYVLKN